MRLIKDIKFSSFGYKKKIKWKNTEQKQLLDVSECDFDKNKFVVNFLNMAFIPLFIEDNFSSNISN